MNQKIDIGIFDGEVPKVTPRSLGETQAQTAENCDLSRGNLKPICDLEDEATLALYETGSGAISASSTTVTGRASSNASKFGMVKFGEFKFSEGVGTEFTSEMNIGDTIKAASQEKVIATISSDILATVTEAFSPALSAGTVYEYGSLGSQPKTIFKLNDDFWLTFNSSVSVAMAAADNSDDRFFYTDGTKPRCSNDTLASNSGAVTFGSPATSYYLGIPAPSAAPTVAVISSSTGSLVESTSYVYTFVNTWGHEGPPSAPSTVVDVDEGQYVRLSVFQIPVPANYDIIGVRIYRVDDSDDNAEFQFVEDICDTYDDYVSIAEIVANSDVWDDNDGAGELTPSANLQEVLQTEDYDPIPDDAEGLLSLSNGVNAVYSGKNVYLSEPGVPNAYPLKYMQTTDYDIVGLGYYGTTVTVVTAACIYFLDAYDPQAASWVKRPVKQKCVSSRGVVSGDGFCLYPSPDGLVMVSGSGAPVITKSMFTKDQWEALSPENIIAFLYDNKYYAFIEGTNEGFIIDFDPSSRQHYVSFSMSDDYAVWGGYIDPDTDSLYLLIKYGTSYYIKKWEGSTAKFTYTWRSKKYLYPYQMSFSAARIVGDYDSAVTLTDTSGSSIIGTSGLAITMGGVTFKLYKDGELLYTKTVTSSDPFRVPGGNGREWEIELIGDDEIFKVTVAPSMDELMT